MANFQDWYEKFISTDTKEGRFVKRIDGRLVSQAKERGEKMYYAIWDQLAMAAALNPGVSEHIEEIKSMSMYFIGTLRRS